MSKKLLQILISVSQSPERRPHTASFVQTTVQKSKGSSLTIMESNEFNKWSSKWLRNLFAFDQLID